MLFIWMQGGVMGIFESTDSQTTYEMSDGRNYFGIGFRIEYWW
jgi:hypothetical protein